MSQALLHNQQKSNLRQGERLNVPFYLWLTLPGVVSTFIVALAGVINSDIYKNSENLAVPGQAQDLVTLIVALPTLLLSTWYVTHESIRARIIWLGAMIYLAYTYASLRFRWSLISCFCFTCSY